MGIRRAKLAVERRAETKRFVQDFVAKFPKASRRGVATAVAVKFGAEYSRQDIDWSILRQARKEALPKVKQAPRPKRPALKPFAALYALLRWKPKEKKSA